MSLLDVAAADLTAILSNASDFAVEVLLEAPSGQSATIHGIASDIGQSIDPETGVMVAGRKAQVTLPTASLASIGQPRGSHDESDVPWLVTLQLPGAARPSRFKVVETLPDRLGALVCLLEAYV